MNNFRLNYILVILALLSTTGFTFAAPNEINENNAKESLNTKSNYRLNTGDRILIEVYGEPDLTRDAVLMDQGQITYPLLGELKLNGFTPKELEKIITKGLKGRFLINPEVSVSVIEYRPFFINGEIKNSGSYPYQPGLTLRKAIALAGGLTEYASKDTISVIQESDAAKKPTLIKFERVISPGDIITIPGYKRVYINGQVKNPGSYPYQSGLTLRKVITLAGGFTQRAEQDSGYIISEGDSDDEPNEFGLEYLISPGDIITIKQSFF